MVVFSVFGSSSCRTASRPSVGEVVQGYEGLAAASEKTAAAISPVLTDVRAEAGTPADGGAASDEGIALATAVLASNSEQILEGAPASPTTRSPLLLSDVLRSVETGYPLIQAALEEIEAAQGKVVASWGQFDTVLGGASLNQPLGFYQNYRQTLGVSQPLWGGGRVLGGYRIGDGDFEPWFGERETNEGGEFKAGLVLPMLRDRNIDSRRAGVWTAQSERDQVVAGVNARLLLFQRYATQAYWEWVAAGQAVQAQRKLLELAQTRVGQISQRVAAGDLPEIARIDNDRFIAKRTVELIKAQRYLQKTAISLSLFYRDAANAPQIVSDDRLPPDWPVTAPLADGDVQLGIAQALALRPELRELAAARQVTAVAVRSAENLILGRLDLLGTAGQDIGGAASSKGDKTPFEMEVGVAAEVPLQRREGLGKLRAAQAKLAEINAKLEFTQNKITAEVQDAASAVNAAFAAIEQSGRNVELNQQSLRLAEVAFNAGDIDLIELNIYETAVADARLQWIAVQAEYWIQVAVYETAIRGEPF